jgi:intracellular multiplication protein IcmC
MPDLNSAFSTSGFSTLSLDTIMSSLLSVEKLITGGAYLMGISFAIKALYSMKTLAEEKSKQMSSHGSYKEPVFYMLAAAMLIYFPTGLQLLLNTTFGEGTRILAYAPISSSNATLNSLFGESSTFGAVIAVVVQVVGMIAFIRGWVLIARSASQGQPPGGTGKGIAHVFGGILAMNIVGTLQVVNNTLFGG